MKEAISASNQLLVEFLQTQQKRKFSDAFESISEFEVSLKLSFKMERNESSTVSVALHHRSCIESVPLEVTDTIRSPAPSTAGYAYETRPSADDPLSLFDEQDIDQGFKDSKTCLSEDSFLTEVENAIATSKAVGFPF